jgi:hypothetical protein
MMDDVAMMTLRLYWSTPVLPRKVLHRELYDGYYHRPGTFSLLCHKVQQLRNKWQTMTRVAKHHQQHELLVDL